MTPSIHTDVQTSSNEGINFERLLDSLEAASLLRIHPKTLQRMARNGEIAGIQIGRLWRFRASVLNSWLTDKSHARTS
jgi:excisionase family DNA binding protein